ncbi:mercuric transporter MerT family protein [uncultured Umboniibacter sp.]|uniref:mercuric transporter MerT family protein n=1 Tax=uncultured Umboniibacter sp. TaxID=1798917 RepID=UPI002611BA6B|nr:mercuric transporter MerT family protein [uncultured Umboniibacter sp.]
MSRKVSNLPLIGGVLAAIGASVCCAGPLVLLLLGISGSWISNLTLLEPYRPIFIVAVLVLFGFAGWKVYRPIKDCEPGATCAVPKVRKRRQLVFWLTLLTAFVLVTSNYWILWFA